MGRPPQPARKAITVNIATSLKAIAHSPRARHCAIDPLI
jgi:hypothetical protein